jgi:FtsP/CotA-like multicopper oxidase with cupredoxin domain
MDETDQLAQGMFGPFLVLEPGAEYDPEHDRVFVIGGQIDGDYPVTINGKQEPPPATFSVGEQYRLRFINISRGANVDVALTKNGSPVRWRAVAKDGADLPETLLLGGDADIRTNTGETFDFLWTPTEPGEATLSVRYERFFEVEGVVLRQTLYLR